MKGNIIGALEMLQYAENRFNNCTMETPEFIDAAIYEYNAAIHRINGVISEEKRKARIADVIEKSRQELVSAWMHE